MSESKFRFNEDENLKKVIDYIEGTYGAHYGHEVDGKNVQVVDLWEGMGSLLSTSRDLAIKYLVRFGKKEGFNERDLLKACHYIMLMMYAARNEQKKEKGTVTFPLPNITSPPPNITKGGSIVSAEKGWTLMNDGSVRERKGPLFSPGYTG